MSEDLDAALQLKMSEIKRISDAVEAKPRKSQVSFIDYLVL